MKPRFPAVAVAVVLAAWPAWGHHSFNAEYDRNQPITLHGTVTRLDWRNPHAQLYVDVPAAAGKVANWEFELGSPNGLMKIGWTRYSLKKGDRVTVKGFRAKDGSKLANASFIILPDGKSKLSALSSGDEFGK